MKFKLFLHQVGLSLLLLLLSACNSGTNQEVAKEVVEKAVTLTAQERLEKIKTNLDLVKAEMTKEGDYDCCIQPGCDWCVLHEGECECHDNIKAGKEVCPGCGLGWHNDKGVVQGVKASQVKWNITHEHGEAAEHGESEVGGEDHKEGGHKH